MAAVTTTGESTESDPMLDDLEARLGYRFRERSLLRQALRHASAANELGKDSNERLEFLGDAALSHAAAEMVFGLWPWAGEGALTRGRAFLVREGTLAQVAESLGLPATLEASPGVPRGPGLVADGLEAVLGAILLDGGWRRFRATVRRLLGPILDGLDPTSLPLEEPKSTLQEMAHRNGLPLPIYRQRASSGPEHRRVFHFEVEIDGKVLAAGEGSSKRAAQQAAARAALDALAAESQRQEGKPDEPGG